VAIWPELGWFRIDCFKLDQFKVDWFRVDWFKVDWLTVDWFRVDWLTVDWLKLDWLTVDWLKLSWLKLDWLTVGQVKTVWPVGWFPVLLFSGEIPPGWRDPAWWFVPGGANRSPRRRVFEPVVLRAGLAEVRDAGAPARRPGQDVVGVVVQGVVAAVGEAAFRVS
jgi:hypothetical protein